MNEEREITFDKHEKEKLVESWMISEGKRHGRKGFRVSRYLPAKNFMEGLDPEIGNEMMWDEEYMFFPTLEEAWLAFKSGELEAGRRAF